MVIRGKPNYLINSMIIAKNDMVASVAVDGRLERTAVQCRSGETIFGLQADLQA